MQHRPRRTIGSTTKVTTGHGSLYVTVNFLPGDTSPREVFIRAGHPDSCNYAGAETIARLVSLNLRFGGAVENIIRQLRGIPCCPVIGQNRSIPDAVAQVLEEFVS